MSLFTEEGAAQLLDLSSIAPPPLPTNTEMHIDTPDALVHLHTAGDTCQPRSGAHLAGVIGGESRELGWGQEGLESHPERILWLITAAGTRRASWVPEGWTSLTHACPA